MKKTQKNFLNAIILLFIGGILLQSPVNSIFQTNSFSSTLTIPSDELISPSSSIYINKQDVSVVPLKFKVVASNAMIEDFLKNIAGDMVNITAVLVKGNEDPHTFEPVQSEINALSTADVFFLLGREDLEPWWEGHANQAGWNQSILQDNPDLKVVKLINSSMVQVDPLTGIENPHVWMDPNNAKIMCKMIYQELNATLLESQSTQLTSNYNQYIQKLDGLATDINAAKVKWTDVPIVSEHNAFMYLYNLLKMNRIAIIEEQHGVDPSAGHIQDIREKMLAINCTLIAAMAPNVKEDTITQIARDTNSKIVAGAPLIGMFGYDDIEITTYIQMIEYNLRALDNAAAPDENAAGIPGYNLFIIVGIMGLTALFFVKNTKKSWYKRKS
ncbi:MAG: metal ABC transporter substrate-binding protein [Promethearchaeota archaeon]